MKNYTQKSLYKDGMQQQTKRKGNNWLYWNRSWRNSEPQTLGFGNHWLGWQGRRLWCPWKGLQTVKLDRALKGARRTWITDENCVVICMPQTYSAFLKWSCQLPCEALQYSRPGCWGQWGCCCVSRQVCSFCQGLMKRSPFSIWVRGQVSLPLKSNASWMERQE